MVQQEEAAVARQRLGKHVSAATKQATRNCWKRCFRSVLAKAGEGRQQFTRWNTHVSLVALLVAATSHNEQKT
jgi:hypothetical protein